MDTKKIAFISIGLGVAAGIGYYFWKKKQSKDTPVIAPTTTKVGSSVAPTPTTTAEKVDVSVVLNTVPAANANQAELDRLYREYVNATIGGQVGKPERSFELNADYKVSPISTLKAGTVVRGTFLKSNDIVAFTTLNREVILPEFLSYPKGEYMVGGTRVIPAKSINPDGKLVMFSGFNKVTSIN